MGSKIKLSWRLFRQTPLKKNLINWFGVTMSLIGIGLTIKEIIDFGGGKSPFVRKDSVWLVVISIFIGLIIVILKNINLLNKTFEWKHGYEVTVVVGDYFDVLDKFPEGTAVSGMSTTIKTKHAKIDSVYYGIYEKFFQTKKENLTDEMADRFDEIVEIGLKRRVNNHKCDYGEISQIVYPEYSNSKKTAFLIANSTKEIGRHEFHGNSETLSHLCKLWNKIYEGDVFPDPIVMPMLGTGHSGDNSEMSAAIGIVESYFELCYINPKGKKNNKTLVKSLVLSVPSSFVAEEKIILSDLHDYISLKNNLLDILYVNKGKYEKVIDSECFKADRKNMNRKYKSKG
ncbi:MULTISPECIES: hypothetical protein [Vagococcus]|uniref:Uncharacterized protein n=1 Tax=Vagococcus fluvialis bH819 TaxID=1255619 RepID=A0A1X6WJX6_9ENTE|nr:MULTISPECIES: hypothetical protein [Vagococcus]SLM84530.1 hypothetical protein FM121_00460 [Vagococcus fluvialis bH819]HCM90006.1 hypothetical protein [Vagococcus sp.]